MNLHDFIPSFQSPLHFGVVHTPSHGPGFPAAVTSAEESRLIRNCHPHCRHRRNSDRPTAAAPNLLVSSSGIGCSWALSMCMAPHSKPRKEFAFEGWDTTRQMPPDPHRNLCASTQWLGLKLVTSDSLFIVLASPSPPLYHMV